MQIVEFTFWYDIGVFAVRFWLPCPMFDTTAKDCDLHLA